MSRFTPPQLPPEFYDSTPVLRHLQRLAESRGVAPDALLLTTLCRVLVLAPPRTRIESHLDTPLSLNFFAGLVGSPGDGKSLTWRVAREVVPMSLFPDDALDDRGLSSGEGLIDAFLGATVEEGGRKTRRQVVSAVAFYLDEGRSLFTLGGREGSVLLPTLRSAFSGSTLSTTNADAERRRHLNADDYRLTLCVGFQPTNAAQLLRDDSEGTPHRFVFASSRNRAMPEFRPPSPGPIRWNPPREFPDLIRVAPEIRGGLWARHRERHVATEEPDALDTHGDAIQLKLSAAFAFLHGATAIGTAEWGLAGRVSDNSRAIRRALTEYAAVVNREHLGRKGEERATVDNAADDAKALPRIVRTMISQCVTRHERGGRTPTGQLLNYVAGRDRGRFTNERLLNEVRRDGRLREVNGVWEPTSPPSPTGSS